MTFSFATRVRAIGAVAFAASLAVISAGLRPAVPHTALKRSEPAKDTTIAAAPKTIALYFTEAVKPAVAGVTLRASDSSAVELGALTTGAGTPAPIVAPVKGAMKAGTYRVTWRVAGEDGHPTTGSFVFTIKSAAK